MKNIITNIFESDEDLEGAGFIPVVSDGTNNFELKSEDGDDIPILPLRNVVMFPDVVLPVSMGRRKSLNAVRHAYNTKGLLAAFTQKDSKVENPKASDLYGVGVVVSVVKILEWDGNTTAILQGRQRVELVSIDAENPFYKGRVSPLYDVMPGKNESKEFNALLEAIKDTASRIIKGSGNMPPEAMFAIRNLENPSAFINFTSANLGLQDDEKQKLLSISDLKDRGYLLLSMLNQKLQLVEIKQAIQNKTHEGIDQQQREYFLQQQIKTIQNELGDSQSKFVEDLKKKAEGKKWSPARRAKSLPLEA